MTKLNFDIMIAVRRFVTLALLAGLSWGLEAAYGQMRTYFEDACAEGLSGMYWNLEESTQIEAAGAPYYMLSVNGHESMPAWASDPDGKLFYRMSFGERIPVATTPLEGTYVLLTRPFLLAEGNAQNRFTLEYVYQATGSSSAKSFGLMVRELGGEWDTVSRLYSLGDAIEPETEGTFSVDLPGAYGGKEVELALFCSNLDTVPFAFAFRNVSFEAWNGKALLVAGVCERVVSEGGSLGLDLVFRNGGLEGLASAEMSWMVNSSAVQKISVDEAIGSGEETDASLELAAEDLLLDQANVLKVWNSEVDGEAVAHPDTLVWRFVYVSRDGGEPLKPLVEIFTSATCGPCRAMNRALLPVFEQLKMGDSLNILKYQVNIPQPDKYYIPVNGERADYYGVNSAPAPFYNGTVSMKDWYDEAWTEAVPILREHVAASLKEKAMIAIDFARVALDSAAEILDIDLNLSSYADIQANVIVAVFEGTTTGNRGSNGETSFHWVNMAMPAGAMGVETDFKVGEPVALSYHVDMSETNVENYADLEVLCFVQDLASKWIYQSAGYDIRKDTFPVETALEGLPGLPEVRLWPNPARTQAFLSGLEDASVQVFDLTGRLIYQVQSGNGRLELPVSDFVAGQYVLRIEQRGRMAVRRLTVVR